jgi:PmbA protein
MKEIIRSRIRQTSLSLTRNQITAIRRKDISRTGCRIIDQGKISVAGCLGLADTEELFARAAKLLPEGVEYPVETSANLEINTNLASLKLSDSDLCQSIEMILARLSEMHPDFFISNKVNLSELTYSLKNDAALNLNHHDRYLTISFLLKEASSTGIMDTFFGITTREFEEEKIISSVDEIIRAFKNKIDLPEENLPVIIDQSTLTRLFLRDLNGKLVGNKASLFQQQIGEQVFSEDFSLFIPNDPIETFSPIFDAEGTVATDETRMLVERGRILRPYTDKRTAKQFGFINTGCASGNYDSVPTLGSCQLEVAHSNKSLKQLLAGKNGILVAIASGGDFTSDGQFASPVQVAYLTDGEKLIGRLPELTISGSIFDFFGRDFIGISADRLYTAGDERLAVVNLNSKRL